MKNKAKNTNGKSVCFYTVNNSFSRDYRKIIKISLITCAESPFAPPIEKHFKKTC